MSDLQVVAEPGSAATLFTPVTPFRPSLVVRAVCDGLRLGFNAQYAEGVNNVMKKAGFAWSRFRRMWVVPVAQAREAMEQVRENAPVDLSFSLDDLRDKGAVAWLNKQPDFFTELLDAQLIPLEDGRFACTFEFDALAAQAMRELGGKFHKYANAWEVARTKQEILQVLQRVAGIREDFVFVHEHHMRLEQLVARSKSEAPITVPGAPPPFAGDGAREPGEVVGNGFLSAIGSPMAKLQVDDVALRYLAKKCGLRSYQVEGVRFLAERSAALLGDDMGLGKSRQAAVAARLIAGDEIVLVVCPASLCINWQREINAVFPDEQVAFIGEHSLEECAKARWIVANYERLAGLVKATDLPLACMLVDEAHNLKEYQAGRTRNAFLLAERIKRRFLLTGTPILNREVEMHTLLRLSGHPLGELGLKEFRKRYAGSSANRGELADQIRDWMLRRGKDVLTDLGKKIEQVRYVNLAGGLASYERILKDATMQTMPKLMKLREHLEHLKVDFIVESIQALPYNQKALIFVEFTETVDMLVKALADVGIKAVSIIGAHSPKQRMKAVDALQNDRDVQVLIGTSKAAGVGLTLTRANYVFLMSLPWTNALKRQSEDRAYRSGNTSDVFVMIPIIAGTLDEQVMALLNSKEEIEDDVVEALRVAVTA